MFLLLCICQLFPAEVWGGVESGAGLFLGSGSSVHRQETVKKRSDFTYELFPFLTVRGKKSCVVH